MFFFKLDPHKYIRNPISFLSSLIEIKEINSYYVIFRHIHHGKCVCKTKRMYFKYNSFYIIRLTCLTTLLENIYDVNPNLKPIQLFLFIFKSMQKVFSVELSHVLKTIVV